MHNCTVYSEVRNNYSSSNLVLKVKVLVLGLIGSVVYVSVQLTIALCLQAARSTPNLTATPPTSTRKSLSAGNLSLYSDLPPTPQGPGEMIVSPLVKTDSRRSSALAKSIPSPRFYGVRELLRTPKRLQPSPRLTGVREMLVTPKAGKTPRLAGVRALLKTPKSRSSPQLAGVREMVKSPRQSTSPKLAGVRNLLKTPKSQSSPQLAGIQELWKTPRVSPSPAKAQKKTPAPRGRKRALSGASVVKVKRAKVVSVSPSVEAPVQRAGTRGRRRTAKSPSPVKPVKASKRSSKVVVATVEPTVEVSSPVG